MADVRTGAAQCIHQEGGGGHTIHIIISVDGDRLIMPDCMDDAIHSGFHACQLKWVGIEAWHSPHKGPRLLVIGKAAVEQDLLENGREPYECFISLRRNRRVDHPAFIMHWIVCPSYP